MSEDQEYIKEHLNEIAKQVNTMLPEGTGFILFAFDFGDEEGTRRMQYISNANREDAFKALQEFMTKINDQNYGKHVDLEGGDK